MLTLSTFLFDVIKIVRWIPLNSLLKYNTMLFHKQVLVITHQICSHKRRYE